MEKSGRQRSRRPKGGDATGNGNDIWGKILQKKEDEKKEILEAMIAVPEPKEPKEGEGKEGEGEEGKDPDAAATEEPKEEKKVKKPDSGSENFVLFVGNQGSGKSSLIKAFLNPKAEDTPKPTVALEYTFGRRLNTTSTYKDVAHIWELGGGMVLTPERNLVNVVFTPERLEKSVATIVVDLSKPGDVIPSVARWLRILEENQHACFEKLKRKEPHVADLVQLKSKEAWSGGGVRHPDISAVRTMKLPVIIVASKYDVFKTFESQIRKPVLQALRFYAHIHGATLLCAAANDKTLVRKFTAVLNSHVFGAKPVKALEMDYAKPLMIPAAMDTLERIGGPKGSLKGNIESMGYEEQLRTWRHAVMDVAKPSDEAEGPTIAKDSEMQQYRHPAIDARRIEKEEELNHYRREVERKLKMSASVTGTSSKSRSAGSKSREKPSRSSAQAKPTD